MAQIAAEALGIEEEQGSSIHKVRVTETCTDQIANTSPTAASSGSDLNGMAVYLACQEVHKRLSEVEDEMIKEQQQKEKENINPNSSIIQKQDITKGNPKVTWAFPLCDIIKRAFMQRVSLTGNGFYKTPTLTENNPFAYYVYGASVSEVEIDALTGNSRVVKVNICYDAGQSLNPQIDVGQIEGGYIQGLGYYMLEEQIIDKNGRNLTSNLGAYKIPTTGNLPIDFCVSLLRNTPNKFPSIYGSKAIGEPPLV